MASISLTASKNVTADPGVYSITGASIGAADPARTVIVAVVSQGDNTSVPNGCTVGGVAATQIVNTGTSADGRTGAIYAIPVPAGTTADIAVTFAGTAPNFGGMFVWRMLNGGGAHASGSDFSEPYAAALDIPRGGVAVGASINAVVGGSAVTWTNLTLDVTHAPSANSNVSGASAAFATAQTALSLQADWTNTSLSGCGVFASWKSPSFVFDSNKSFQHMIVR